jgi:hypothetical protein
MSEKCYYEDCGYGYGENQFPDECDDCGEYFCMKHLKIHKKDGTCKKLIKEYEEDIENFELGEIPTKILKDELKRRKDEKKY